MKLSYILKDISTIDKKDDRIIKGLTFDSREVENGYLYVAVKGFKQDGHRYLAEAKKKGAVAALVQENDPGLGLFQVKVESTRKALAKAAANYYNHPTAYFDLIGITGTNGKTTIAYLLESIFKAAGYKSGLIGTVEYRVGDKSIPVTHTTPESVHLQRLFADMKIANVEKAVMEVSSHASQLHRVDNCAFKQVIFTNLTQDHLDFHVTIDQYFEAKKRLFEINDQAIHIVNGDDDFGRRLMGVGKKTITYGINNNNNFKVSNLEITDQSSHFNVHFEGRDYRFEIMLGGFFNIYNALAAIASAINSNISPEVIQHGLFNLKAIPGRFEILQRRPFKIIVDYAHTPDGLENLLKSARQITKGKLITVFGCGGDRDSNKRPKMGKIASTLADIAIVTSDNPRREKPEDIIKHIIKSNSSFVTKIDRREAIEEALRIAKEKDTVVIAGKGHETTQEIDGNFIPFNDKEVVREILQAGSWG